MKRARGWLLLCPSVLLWGFLLWGFLLWTPTAAAQPAKPVVTVARPATGETLSIEVPPGVTLALAFDLADTFPDRRYPDLWLEFDDGARVVLRNLMLDEQVNSVEIAFEGITIPAYAVAGAPAAANGHSAEPPEPAPTPGPPAANGGSRNGHAPPDLANLRHTGRDLLFAGEAERPGHPLYSYLLFAGASTGEREERRRFRAAIEAFVAQVASAEALEEGGAAREEINIFYAPVTAFLADATPDSLRRHFAERSMADQVALLLQHYDRARAEVLIGRMRLTGNGPYIVSLLRPLTREAVAAEEAFLVQDLSGVPPELVELWVVEFKRQVVQEATQSPEHLRRLALSLRTQVAVLAEAFAITRSAVAEMFDEPAAGDGN
jgi:hypothetical protein